jgi:hypothetical protein
LQPELPSSARQRLSRPWRGDAAEDPQGPLPDLDASRRPAPPARPLDPAEEAALAGDVAAVPDDLLRRALAGLGRALRRTAPR